MISSKNDPPLYWQSKPRFRKDQGEGISVAMNSGGLRKGLEPCCGVFPPLLAMCPAAWTRGVRAVVLRTATTRVNGQHKYVAGWHCPAEGETRDLGIAYAANS